MERKDVLAVRRRRETAHDGRIVVLAPMFPPAEAGGGPIRTLEAMLRRAQRTELCVMTSAYDLDSCTEMDVPLNIWTDFNHRKVVYITGRNFLGCFRLLAHLWRENPQGIYVNSVFNPLWSIFPLLLCRLSVIVPDVIVVAPRGEFQVGALAIKSLKKRIFLKASRIIGLHRRVTWHASTLAEASGIRAVAGGNANVVVHENESLLPDAPSARSRSFGDVTRIVFLSRISPKKGLHLLLEAAQGVESELFVDIYGPIDDASYHGICRRLCSDLPSHVTVSWMGHLEHGEVTSVLSNYDAFVLPTAGENFGHVIAEALGSGLPIYLPDTTPWSESARSCGGVVPRDVDSWTVALNDLASMSVEVKSAKRLAAEAEYANWVGNRSAVSFLDLDFWGSGTSVGKRRRSS